MVNSQASNPLTLGWGITTVVVGVLFALVLFWNISKGKKLSFDTDPYGGSSDCFSARVLFIVVLFATVISLLYFIIYKFATIAGDNHLSQYFLATHDSEKLAGYHSFLADKASWLNFLSVINIIIGLHTAFVLFALTNSPLSVRIYLNVALLSLAVLSFVLIRQHQAMTVELPSPNWNGNNTLANFHKRPISEEWSYNLVNVFAIAAIPLSFLTILANNSRLKNGTFILGTIILVLVGLTVTSVGYISRDYRVRIKHYSGSSTGSGTNDWSNEVCYLDRKFLEAQEANRKYIYKNYELCPARLQADTYKCVENPATFTGKTTPQCDIWETSIIPSGATAVQRAIVNERMRGVVSLLYTRPVLYYVAFGLAWIFTGFIIAAFAFFLSSREKGNANPAALNYIFLALFVVFLVVAFIFSGLNPPAPYPFKPNSIHYPALAVNADVPEVEHAAVHTKSFKISMAELEAQVEMAR